MNPYQQLPEFSPETVRKNIRLGLIAALAFLILAALRSMFFSVEPEGRAVIQRFGKVIDIKNPGLHFKLPLGIDRATFVPTERVLKEEFGFRTAQAGQRSQYEKTRAMTDESLMLTGDLNVIDVEWVVQFRVTDPVKYLFEVRNPRETIRDVSESVMRRIVGNRLGSEVLTVGRVEIAHETLADMQEILDTFNLGVRIERIELQDVTPPDKVKPAFNEVNEARQQRERLINEAEKQRNQIIPRARGEADEIVAEAEAYRAERTNLARGEAARFLSLLEAYREQPAITARRFYLEMVDDVLPNLRNIYILEEGMNAPLPLLNLGQTLRDGQRSGGQ